MEFGILGPLEVLIRGEPSPVGPPKHRSLLAALLIRNNQVASSEWLIEQLWGSRPPASATATMQLYVSQLRRRLGIGPGRSGKPVLLTRSPGYLLQIEPAQLDLNRFEELISAGRRSLAAGAVEAASATLRKALALWRGPALDDIESESLRRGLVPYLEERRLCCLEERIEADLAIGRADVVSELTALVVEHPLRERLHAQLMRALLNQGRRADALVVYRNARQRIRDELGLEPSALMVGLERAVLTGDQTHLGLAQPETVVPAPPKPAQLPSDVAGFVGRLADLGRVEELMESSVETRVCTIAGKPGVGKTAIAVHAAHRLRERFPDGQLFAALHGTCANPTSSAEVLANLLRALGVESRLVPDEEEERAALYRSRLADRRVLVVLDDAADESQVRPLLPGGAGCAVLVTSRRRLTGLAVGRPILLDVLDEAESACLLERMVGPARIAAEPEAAAAVVGLCGGLPLALRIVGARLAAKPHWRLADIAQRLTSDLRRLDELSAGDLQVRASFAMSYDALPAGQQRAFRRLGAIDQRSVTDRVAGWAFAVSREQANDLLEGLVDAQLLEVAGRDATGAMTYRLHDLLRLFARERMTTEESAEAVHCLLGAVFGGYIQTAESASATLAPAAACAPAHDCAAAAAPDGTAECGQDDEVGDARAWFMAEQGNLVAAIEQSPRAGLSHLTWRLARALGPYLEERSLWGTWRQTHELAIDAARRVGDRAAEASLLQRLGDLYRNQGLFEQAEKNYEDSRQVAESIGDEVGVAYARRGLADVAWGLGRPSDAVRAYQEILPAFRAAGARPGEAHTLRGLAVAYRGMNRLPEALVAAEEAVAAFRSLGDRSGEAYALRSQALVYVELRRFVEAAQGLRLALDIFGEIGDRLGTAASFLGLGTCHADDGRGPEAVTAFRRSIEAFAEVGDELGEMYARRGLADAFISLGRNAEALHELRICLPVFCRHRDLRWEAYARYSLGALHIATRKWDAAVEELDRSVALFGQIQAPRWVALAQYRLGNALAGRGDREQARCVWLSASKYLADNGAAEVVEVDAALENLDGIELDHVTGNGSEDQDTPP